MSHQLSTPHPLPTHTPLHMSSRLHSAFEHGKLRGGDPSSRSGAGLLPRLLQAAVPKRLFSHFYLLGIATSAMVMVDVLFYGGSLFTAGIQVRRPGVMLDCMRSHAPADPQRDLRSESVQRCVQLNSSIVFAQMPFPLGRVDRPCVSPLAS